MKQSTSILKIVKVIQSCITLDHIEATYRMVHTFAKQYSSPAGKRFGEQLWHFDDGAAEAYNELWLMVREKELKILG
jgi:hypothetical protein